ncbi:unnamed protein product [Durusdinium trenchii]|uniref:Uncharacterized protein n=1 Tax=Durusdinium trenchii TaxID=1381693 RepID=A0ABP0QRE8_9DINO
MDAGEMQVACILWLHLALIQRWSRMDANPHSVSTLLCAELFVNANLDTSGMGTRTQAESLGFLDTEIFELFHATRSRVYRWLRTKTNERDHVLEHVVSTVASSPARSLATSTSHRRWSELEDTWDGSGRFAPSITGDHGSTGPNADEDFPRWLAASVDSAPLEVNVNLGQLQFRQHNVTAVPREVLELPEFQEVFPEVEVNSCLLWALVEKTQQRDRYRFAGLRYEFHLWKLDHTTPEIPFSRRFPQHATVAEDWISSAISTCAEIQTLPDKPRLCRAEKGRGAEHAMSRGLGEDHWLQEQEL